jgi:uncharacterized protein YukE
MTDEERQRQIDFIIEQQAQFTVQQAQLTAQQVQLAATVERLGQKVEQIGQKVDRTADSVIALLAIAEIHERERKETDARLNALADRVNALIDTVEQHISEGHSGQR